MEQFSRITHSVKLGVSVQHATVLFAKRTPHTGRPLFHFVCFVRVNLGGLVKLVSKDVS